jgi:hypothetical protein
MQHHGYCLVMLASAHWRSTKQSQNMKQAMYADLHDLPLYMFSCMPNTTSRTKETMNSRLCNQAAGATEDAAVMHF